MVRKLFYVLVALLALGAPALAGGPICDDCDVFRHGVHRKVTPTPHTRCVPFVQSQRGDVLLRLDLKNGKTRSYRKKNASTVDCIVVGRSWLKDQTASMFICNDDNHAVYPYEDVQAVSAGAKMSRANEACLFGQEVCGQMGYKTR